MSGAGHDDSTDFDLTALMDVLSNIIFFLMASFGAAVVAVLPATVPTISDAGETDVARDEDKITLKLRLDKAGKIDVSVENAEMLPDELLPFARSFAPGAEGIDAAAVSAHLWSIKERFRKSKDVVIIPDPDVTYGRLVDAMDVARERRMLVDGKAVFPEMFPAVVVSSLVK